VHSVYGEDTRVLHGSVNCTVSVLYAPYPSTSKIMMMALIIKYTQMEEITGK